MALYAPFSTSVLMNAALHFPFLPYYPMIKIIIESYGIFQSKTNIS
jgi:hypothetical protein